MDVHVISRVQGRIQFPFHSQGPQQKEKKEGGVDKNSKDGWSGGELRSMRDDENCSDGNTLSTDTNTSHDKGPNESGEVAGNVVDSTPWAEAPKNLRLQWRRNCMYRRANTTVVFEAPCQALCRRCCCCGSIYVQYVCKSVNLTS